MTCCASHHFTLSPLQVREEKGAEEGSSVRAPAAPDRGSEGGQAPGGQGEGEGDSRAVCGQAEAGGRGAGGPGHCGGRPGQEETGEVSEISSPRHLNILVFRARGDALLADASEYLTYLSQVETYLGAW